MVEVRGGHSLGHPRVLAPGPGHRHVPRPVHGTRGIGHVSSPGVQRHRAVTRVLARHCQVVSAAANLQQEQH